MQVEISTLSVSDEMLKLDPLELPAEFRLLSTAPALGTWQYTQRPIDLNLRVNFFEPGTTATQVVEFSEANSRVSQDGELVTDVLYYVKSRGRRTFKLKLPGEPVRLWEVSVNGQPVTARQADDATLIPLPGGTDPNIPIEVSLRLGKPTVDESRPELTLPVVFAPVLKTQWKIAGDEKHLLVPSGGTVAPPVPVLRPSGFDWVARRGLFALFVIGLFTALGIWACRKAGKWNVLGLVGLALAIVVSISTASTALSQIGSPTPLQLSLPILSAEEVVQLEVANMPMWRVDISWLGVFACLAGIAAIVWSWTTHAATRFPMLNRWVGILFISLGVLLQGGGAPWFFGLLGLTILAVLFARPAIESARQCGTFLREWNERRKSKPAKSETGSNPDSGSAVTATSILLAMLLSAACTSSPAAVPDGFEPADSIQQQWTMSQKDSRLSASGTISLSGKPGDRFLLLRAPGVLTKFEGEGLRLTKRDVPGEGLTYIISIPIAAAPSEEVPESVAIAQYDATFAYQLEPFSTESVPVLTGTAAVQQIELNYDEGGWEVVSPSAVSIESIESDKDVTNVRVLLGPGIASLCAETKGS